MISKFKLIKARKVTETINLLILNSAKLNPGLASRRRHQSTSQMMFFNLVSSIQREFNPHRFY